MSFFYPFANDYLSDDDEVGFGMPPMFCRQQQQQHHPFQQRRRQQQQQQQQRRDPFERRHHPRFPFQQFDLDDYGRVRRPRQEPRQDEQETLFRAQVNVWGFDPAALRVTADTKLHTLVVTAEDAAFGRRLRETVAVPPQFDLARVKAAMGRDGRILYLEAPLKQEEGRTDCPRDDLEKQTREDAPSNVDEQQQQQQQQQRRDAQRPGAENGDQNDAKKNRIPDQNVEQKENKISVVDGVEVQDLGEDSDSDVISCEQDDIPEQPLVIVGLEPID